MSRTSGFWAKMKTLSDGPKWMRIVLTLSDYAFLKDMQDLLDVAISSGTSDYQKILKDLAQKLLVKVEPHNGEL